MSKEYVLGLYEKSMPSDLTWEEKLNEAKNSGFDFVEISIDETDEKLERLDMSSGERFELIRTMQETGVPIRSMCLSGHRRFPMGSHDRDIRERSMDIMRKAIGLSEDLGIRIIQLAGYDVYYEDPDDDTRKYFEENLQKAVLMASKAGVSLGFETMETEFMNTVEKSMYYVDLIDSPYLGVYPDLGNLTNAAVTYGTDVTDDLKTGSGHLFAMHLKETTPGVFREVPFGTGHVDFERGIRCAWDLGIRRFGTEFWYKGSPKWRDDLIFAGQMMRGFLDRQEEDICS